MASSLGGIPFKARLKAWQYRIVWLTEPGWLLPLPDLHFQHTCGTVQCSTLVFLLAGHTGLLCVVQTQQETGCSSAEELYLGHQVLVGPWSGQLQGQGRQLPQGVCCCCQGQAILLLLCPAQTETEIAEPGLTASAQLPALGCCTAPLDPS